MRGIVSISDSEGGVKGYVGTPGGGELALKDAIGEGSINIVKVRCDVVGGGGGLDEGVRVRCFHISSVSPIILRSPTYFSPPLCL